MAQNNMVVFLLHPTCLCVCFQAEPSQRLFREVTQAFKGAVATTKGDSVDQCRYVVSDSAGKVAISIIFIDKP